MKKIEITFKTDGTSKVEAVGFNGVGCKEATKSFEDALGVVGKRTIKAEYHSRVSTSQNQKLGGAK